MVEVIKKTTIVGSDEKAEKSQTAGYIIYFLCGLVEILLIFRLILKLTGANPGSTFVSLIYSVTQLSVIPFLGIFPQTTGQGVTTTAIFEPATLVAIIVYAVLAWSIIQLVTILSRRQQ
ncbi:MAG TPA: hypothetical protein VLG12_04435 [Candidatus Saccharimonadales bacterium]|nr:hypothetical protein [Candidatus Saccharimonadales bacterium]